MADQQPGPADPMDDDSQQEGPAAGAEAAAGAVEQQGDGDGGEAEDIDLEEDEVEELHAWGFGEGEDFSDDMEDYEEEVGLPEDMDSEELDEYDDEELWDDEDDERLSIEKRVELECGLMASDAHIFEGDAPIRHKAISSTVVHHQTADVLTLLPAPAPPEEAAAAVAAAAAGAGVGVEGDSQDDEAAATAAAVGGVAKLPPEDVVVSCKGVLSVYRLQAGQPSKLMARSDTLFRPYSLAASTCGNYIAATGNWGLLSLFRVVRSSSSSDDTGGGGSSGRGRRSDRQTSAAAQQVPGSNPVAGAQNAGQGQQTAEQEPELEWQLLHVATLMCRNGVEMMVNSVRFGHFAGRLRMLVAHQDGMVYLFDLPGQHAAAAHGMSGSSSGGGKLPATAALTVATAAAAARPRSAALAGEAAALMVQDVPNWEPMVEINSRYVQHLMALIPPEQRRPTFPASSATAAAAGTARQQQEHVGQQQVAAAAAAAFEARLGPDGVACSGGLADAGSCQTPAAAAPMPAAPAASTLRQQLFAAIDLGEKVLAVLIDWLVERDTGLADLTAVADVLLGRQQQAAHPSKGSHNTAEQQQQQQPQLQQHAPDTAQPLSDPACAFAKTREVGSMLTNPGCLSFLRGLAKHRHAFTAESFVNDSWAGSPTKVAAMRQWPAAVDALRALAAGQWALLGTLGEEQQQQQWQQLQAEGETDREVALARAVYVLMLLRVLAPMTEPSIRQGVKVLVLRHGHAANVANGRLSSADLAGATQLTTCAITNLVRDEEADQAAQAALARATADINAVLAQPGLLPEVHGAAAIALADATRTASQPHLLPLNIVEASPDGQWLAVGSDQLAVVLVPAGPGYQHQVCHVLDVCPWGDPRMANHLQQGTLGCQYMSFNNSSTLLAASCDALRLVMVWGVAGPGLGQRVASFSLHNRTVLPVRFLPPHHPLTALQQGVAAAARAAAEAAAAEAVESTVAAPRVLQMHAGAAALSAEAVAAAGVLQPGARGRLADRLLAYCECFGGLHLADMSMFFHSASTSAPAEAPTDGCRTSTHFCLKTYVELSHQDPQQQQQQLATPVAAAAGQPQQQQVAGDAEMAEDVPGPVDPAVAEAEAFLDGMGAVHPLAVLDPEAAAAAAAVAAAVPNGNLVLNAVGGALAEAALAAAAAAGQGLEAYDASRAPRITGLVLTPAGRLLVAISDQLLEWKLITSWGHHNHSRFPAAFRSAVKTVLLAAAHANGNSSPTAAAGGAATSGNCPMNAACGSGSNSGQQLVAQLPGPVLEQVFAAAALPQACWTAAELPSFTQLCEALEQRPFPA